MNYSDPSENVLGRLCVSVKIVVQLYGLFKVTTEDGIDLTPKSARGRAIVALLATSKGYRRPRIWIQEKLWSDRSDAQASGSLRQALLDVRKSLGEFRDVLGSNRSIVWLEKALVVVKDRPSEDQAEDFLEGLHVKDPEFEAWLKSICSQFARTTMPLSNPPAQTGLVSKQLIILEQTSKPGTSERFIEDSFSDNFQKSLQETFSIQVALRAPANMPLGTLVIAVQAFEPEPGKLGIRVTIEDNDLQQHLWASSVIAEFRPGSINASPHHLNLSNLLLGAVSDILACQPTSSVRSTNANYLAGRGMRALFSMRPDQIELADQLFEQAFEIEERGNFLAMRAQTAVIKHVEQLGYDFQELSDQSDEFSKKAVALDSLNSGVLSAIANARLVFEGNTMASRELSKLAVDINPSNPLAWWAWSNSLLYSDEFEKAYRFAQISQRLAARSHLKFWTDFQVSITAAATERWDEAISNGELSRSLSPHFKPALRYLIALHGKNNGNCTNTKRYIDQLSTLEPGFTVERLLNDVDYPASRIRGSALADANSHLHEYVV